MRPHLSPEQWRPLGIDELEPDAENAVRSSDHIIVIAGPGAGKTEILAQKACYLLQTGLCPNPRRILAISFKKDAARNLGERVEERCGSEMSRRFDSQTFDKFAKSLLDRFRLALPQQWRPAKDYKIVEHRRDEIQHFLDSLAFSSPPPIGAKLRALIWQQFLHAHVFGNPLRDLTSGYPFTPTVVPAQNIVEWAARRFWEENLHNINGSLVSFSMIERLAELLLFHNPQLLRALRTTYSHVFLDEFQDTTQIQYDLVKTAFLGSGSVLSAVGDNKQRIMGFAMALPDAFKLMQEDFSATVFRPKMNYRSSPELVRIQQHLIRSLDADSTLPEAAKQDSCGDDSCRILVFSRYQHEAKHMAAMIAQMVIDEHIPPRQICVLVKQTVDNYASLLKQELSLLGINSRNESEVQDLLTEPVTETLLLFLKVCLRERAGELWGQSIELVNTVRSFADARGMYVSQRDLSEFRLTLRPFLNKKIARQDDVYTVCVRILQFLGVTEFRQVYPQYQDIRFLDMKVRECARQLFCSLETGNTWLKAIEEVEGTNTVPIMTIHKSKGLEYHTVIFLGLEDSAFWNFMTQPFDDACTFFVAFSRAKQRVIFTFSSQRQTKPERGIEQQRRNTIGVLYELLQSAGVESETIEDHP